MRPVVSLLIVAFLSTGCSSDESPSTADTAASAGVTGGDFHSLVADPLRPGRLFVGGHTNVARSDDGGTTWQPVNALDDADAMGWTVERELVWVSGHPGLNVSRDGGATFERRNDGLPDTDVHAFGANGDRLYAAGPGLGVAGSADGGLTWTTLTDQAGRGFFGRILIDPADPSHLVASDAGAGAVESRDAGRTWALLGTDPGAWISTPDGLRTIYISGQAAAQRSADGGRTWTGLTLPAGATLVEAAPDGTLYAGVHDGRAVTVWTSADGGATWTQP